MGVYPGTPPIRSLEYAGGMKELSEKEMEQISGGEASASQCKAWDIICVVAGFGSFGGLLGALVFGPTNLMCLLDDIVNYSKCP